jgi:hypothetical protein
MGGEVPEQDHAPEGGMGGEYPEKNYMPDGPMRDEHPEGAGYHGRMSHSRSGPKNRR